ncbi:Uncharacterised protein [Mycobacteroides abscessus subsp. abscessus]|nr:Uncharacterised protein [Mycobacteroides abscessus subsp. abscessus]SKS01442.1 Uncharacterised protein [Mycobacteroides abscessus subsp. massiliense]
MLSKCSPTLATLAWRHIPISICFSSGCDWYQGCRPSGSVRCGSTQRVSLGTTAYSGESQSMSMNGSKFRFVDPCDRVSSTWTYLASPRTSFFARNFSRRDMPISFD